MDESGANMYVCVYVYACPCNECVCIMPTYVCLHMCMHVCILTYAKSIFILSVLSPDATPHAGDRPGSTEAGEQLYLIDH